MYPSEEKELTVFREYKTQFTGNSNSSSSSSSSSSDFTEIKNISNQAMGEELVDYKSSSNLEKIEVRIFIRLFILIYA